MRSLALWICVVGWPILLGWSRGNDYDKSIRAYSENKSDSAEHYIEQAINQYRIQGKSDSLVFAYVQKVLVVWTQISLEEAFRVMDTTLLIAEKLSHKSVARVAAHSRMGQLYTQQYAFDQAKKHFSKAEVAIDPLQRPNRHYMLLYNHIAAMYLMAEDYEPAKRYAQRAYDMNVRLEGKEGKDMAIVLQTRYLISRYSEDFEQALVDGLEFQRVIQLYYPPDHPNIGIMHNSLAIIYEALQRYEEALYHRQRAVDTQFKNYINTKNGYSLAAAYQNLGQLYGYVNEHFLAHEYLAKGSKLLTETYGEDGLGMVKILIDLAVNKYKIGRYNESEDLFKQAYALQQRHAPDDLLGMAYVTGYFGDLYLHTKEYTKAIGFYEQALEQYQRASALSMEMALLAKRNLSIALSEIGRVEEAMTMQGAVLANFRLMYPKGNDAIASKLQDMSETCLAMHRVNEAYAYSDSVFMELLLIAQLPQTISQWVPHLPFSYHTSAYIGHRMRILEQLHTISKNNGYLEELLLLVDHYGEFISQNLHAFRTQATLIDLADNNKEIYSMAIEACWKLADPGKNQVYMERAFAYAERSKALLLRLAANNMMVDTQNQEKDPIAQLDYDFRRQINILNLRYLNSNRDDSLLTQLTSMTEKYRIFQDSLRKSGNEMLSLKYDFKDNSLQDIRKKLLRNRETLIEYAVTDNSIFIFVVSPQTFYVHRLDKGVLREVKKLQNMHGLTATLFMDPAYRLYQSLVKPVEPYFASKRLLIIPDADLYYLNFDVLISHRREERFSRMPYLIRTYDISYLLSAASAMQFKEVYRSQEQKKALLFSPVFTDQMKADYRSSLPEEVMAEEDYLYLYRQPFALQAAKRIGKLISHDLLVEQDAEERRFKQVAPDYRILHLGTHAEVNNQSPLQSRFFFAKAMATDTLNMDDGYLHAYEIYAMQLRAELAVLTACETGAGAWRNGEGVISLAHSFMHAGCPGVVMSLWKIDEQTSTDITTWFYKYLAKGYGKSEALRKAKLYLLNQRDEQLSHPYYWAGLTLIGEPSPIYASQSWWWYLLGVGGMLLVVWFLWKKKRTAPSKIIH